MSRILNKLLDQKLKIEQDIKKANKNIESNKDKIIELYKEIVTIKRAFRNRKNKIKNYDDLSLRIFELKNDISHYKKDTIMLKDRLIEFENLKNNILLRIEKNKADVENMEQNNTIRCGDCNINIHRASYSRHLKTKRHLEKNDIKPKKVIDKGNIKEVNKNKNNKIEYKFTDNIFNIAYDITVDRYHKKDLNSQIITSKFDNTGIEMYYINEIFKEMSHIYAKFINQYKFKYQLSFMLLYYNFEEDGDIRKEAEMTIKLNMISNLTQSEIDNFDIQRDLKARKQKIEMQESGWVFQRVNSKTKSFYNTGNMDGSGYFKKPLRSAILNINNDDKYCFLWSILAKLHPCENSHPDRVSNYEPYFNELNIDGFDFSNGFRCSDMYRFEKLNNLSKNIYELNFYHDQDKIKHKLIPVEISKNESDKVIDLLNCKNHYALIKKLNVFTGKHDCKYICRKCLNSYTSRNMLNKHKKLCQENQKLKRKSRKSQIKNFS